ncbi:MAG: DUF4031 domain-containing protein [Planctomycetota bacterium]|jgi:hypothetical protein
MVYVDEAQVCLRTAKWRYKYAAHLVADSLNELHNFAAVLGLKREWFQGNTLPHYDVTAAMRRKAVAMGAISITREQMGAMIKQYRAADAQRRKLEQHGIHYQ